MSSSPVDPFLSAHASSDAPLETPAGTPPVVRRCAEWCERLNREYLATVARRGLLPADQVWGAAATHRGADWTGRLVDAFLRHDNHDCFCVACPAGIAMGNAVRLVRVRFLVDEPGRRQTRAGEGPLPNGRSIHAVLRGELAECWSVATEPDLGDWRSVVYHPLRDTLFVDNCTGEPIRESDEAWLLPGSVKVWVR